MGGNADRLGALAAGPIAACALFGSEQRWRRVALLVLIAPLTYWQANAPVTDFVSTLSNPATGAAYYRPLLGELARLDIGYGRTPARIEVVPTVDHWEARYVAPAVMIARGWERQLDRYRNGLFYGSGALTTGRYERWLSAQGISYVALPDASLDYSGKAEARLLSQPALTGPGGALHEVWSSAHWRLFAVRRHFPLVVEAPDDLMVNPARLTNVGRSSFTLRAPAGGYLVRLRFSPYWAVTSGRACVSEEGSWTRVDVKRPGYIHVGIRFSLARIFSHGERCN